MTAAPANILIVDDEPALCELIGEELTQEGHRCQSVIDPVEAKQRLESTGFDFLIADIAMPHINGLELLAHARKVLPSCKVILMTGQSSREYLAQALALGAYDFVEKPFGMGEISGLIAKGMDNTNIFPQLQVRAVEAIQTQQQARHIIMESIQALVRTVEAKDPYTRRHSEQVTHYAVNLAKNMNLPADLVETIRTSAILHDIGKIGVPDRILTKPDRLTPEEYQYVYRHPALGADILANISVFAREAELVRHHHECWNGRGYPDGLVGEEIPLGARIINVADSMDAMLMERTYKLGYPVEKMMEELARCSGSQFDPKVARAAQEWCRHHPDMLILPATPVVKVG